MRRKRPKILLPPQSTDGEHGAVKRGISLLASVRPPARGIHAAISTATFGVSSRFSVSVKASLRRSDQRKRFMKGVPQASFIFICPFTRQAQPRTILLLRLFSDCRNPGGKLVLASRQKVRGKVTFPNDSHSAFAVCPRTKPMGNLISAKIVCWMTESFCVSNARDMFGRCSTRESHLLA